MTRYLPALVHAAVVPVLAVAALFVVDWPSALIVVLTLPLSRCSRPSSGGPPRRRPSVAGPRSTASRDISSTSSADFRRWSSTGGVCVRSRRCARSASAIARQTMATLRLSFMSSAALELLATLSVALVAVTVGLRLRGGKPRRVARARRDPPGARGVLADPPSRRGVPRGCRRGASPRTASWASWRWTSRRQRRPGHRRGDDRRPVPVPGGQPAGTLLRDLTLDATNGSPSSPGLSGSGKSTLLELAAGTSHSHIGDGRWRRLPILPVTQRPFLLPDSVRANLQAVRHQRRRPSPPGNGAARAGSAYGVAAGLPATDRETALGDDGFGLSAGQRAHAGRPKPAPGRQPVMSCWTSPPRIARRRVDDRCGHRRAGRRPHGHRDDESLFELVRGRGRGTSSRAIQRPRYEVVGAPLARPGPRRPAPGPRRRASR